jgi:3-oxoacyl-[acyl-carrier-protein] synthase II
MNMGTHRKRRIVITGLGLASPLGIDRGSFAQGVIEGRSGVAVMEDSAGFGKPYQIGGVVRELTEDNAKKVCFTEKEEKKAVKLMCRDILLGTAAAKFALQDSGLDLSSLNHDRLGIEYGANLMFFEPEEMGDACKAAIDEAGEFQLTTWGSAGLRAMEPLWMLKYLPNMPACHIAIFFQALGPNNSVTLDEASPGVAITEALNVLERGAADMMLVGGTGTRIDPVTSIHGQMWGEHAIDPADPLHACRPFDVRRCGVVPGEAGACLLLEEESHALARGAKIWGRILSGASSCVANREGVPDQGRAIVNAVTSAMRRADVSPADIGHYNAHGMGTVAGDRLEAQAVHELFGSRSLPVVGLKGYFGNAGASTGFLELAASLLALNQGCVPATLNTSEPDPALELDVVTGSPRKLSNKLFVTANYTRNGQASAVIVEAT